METKDLDTILGPLASLYSDPEVYEIVVDGPGRVLAWRDGKLNDTNVHFNSPEQVREVIEGIAGLDGQTVDPDAATVEFSLPNERGRGLAVFPPTAVNGPYLVLRRQPPQKAITWEKLIEWGSITREVKLLIEQAIHDHVNILISGGMSSGKTTVLNRVVELIPHEERVVIVEELHELNIDHPRAVYLEAGGSKRLSYTEAVNTCSYMLPDWLIFFELYGPASPRILEILAHGHTGMSTMHGKNVDDTLRRLEASCLKTNPGLGLGEARDLIASAIRLVIHQNLLSNGKRRITEVVEICGVENGHYMLQRLFRYNPDNDQIEPTGARLAWRDEIR